MDVQQPTTDRDSSDVIASLTGEERTHWRMTGELPSRETVADADSTPAELPEAAAPTGVEVEPASEPGAPLKTKGAEARKQQLSAEVQEELRRRAQLREENDRLLRDNERLRLRETPSGSSDAMSGASSAPKPAAAQAAEYQRIKALPDAPKLDAFLDRGETYEDWTVAMQLFVDDVRHAERTQVSQRDDHAVRVIETAARTTQEFERTMPDFQQRVHPDLLAIKPVMSLGPDERVGPHNVIAQELLDSPVMPQLMLHFTEHPDEFARLCALPPQQLLRAFGQVEARFVWSKAAEDSTRAAPSQGTAPSTRVISQAAPPVKPLAAQRTTVPADEASEFLSRGDFAGYRAAMNRREMAARK